MGSACASGTCVSTVSCSDGVKNGNETDVDCGGGTCSLCATGKHCSAATDCQSGVCTAGICAAAAGCQSGQTLCNGVCTNVASDRNNCGGCGNVCNFPNATSACTAGQCGIVACIAGFANCDGIAANGCETATSTNQCPR